MQLLNNWNNSTHFYYTCYTSQQVTNPNHQYYTDLYQFHVYNRSLTQSEILNNYHSYFSTTTPSALNAVFFHIINFNTIDIIYQWRWILSTWFFILYIQFKSILVQQNIHYSSSWTSISILSSLTPLDYYLCYSLYWYINRLFSQYNHRIILTFHFLYQWNT